MPTETKLMEKSEKNSLFNRDTKFSKQAIEFMEISSIELTKEIENKIISYFEGIKNKTKIDDISKDEFSLFFNVQLNAITNICVSLFSTLPLFKLNQTISIYFKALMYGLKESIELEEEDEGNDKKNIH
jgi:hypothetical protein